MTWWSTASSARGSPAGGGARHGEQFFSDPGALRWSRASLSSRFTILNHSSSAWWTTMKSNSSGMAGTHRSRDPWSEQLAGFR